METSLILKESCYRIFTRFSFSTINSFCLQIEFGKTQTMKAMIIPNLSVALKEFKMQAVKIERFNRFLV